MLMPSSRFDLPFTSIDATGVPTAPTGTPTAILVKNGVDQGTSVTVTMTGAQGIASCTIPSDAAAGDRFYIRVSAVISAVTYVVSGPSDAIESPQTLTTAYDPAKSTAPTSASNANAVRAELATELARIDATISSRLATAGYTAPTTTPTPAAIASQVRTELGTELARVDAAISSRATPGAEMALSGGERATLAGVIEAGLLDDLTGGTFMATLQSQIQAILSNSSNTPIEPIASAVATAVRTNLATELARLDTTVSSRLAAASYSAPPSLAGLATSDAVTSLATAINALPSSPQIAAEILIDPLKKLLTNDEGFVTATNGGGGNTGGGNTSTFVMPLRSTSLERVQANRIDLFVRERVPLTISIFDSQRQPVNCEGLECTLCIEGDIEIPGLTPTAETTGGMANRYSFTPPEAMTSAPATRWFSLRVNDVTRRVLAFGHLVIAQVP